MKIIPGIFLSAAGMLMCAIAPGIHAAQEEDTPRTVVESDSLEMNATDERNFFYFKGHVRVTGTNLTVECENLDVITARSGDTSATIGELTAIESIVATGNVIIFQEGRRIEAGRAELKPHEGLVVLTDKPKIIDPEAEISGWRITLLKGERKALVEGNPEHTGMDRPTVMLDSLPDLGYEDKEPESAEQPLEGDPPINNQN